MSDPSPSEIEEIRAWARSPEGVAKMKEVCEWARRKKKELERRQRISPDRLDKRMTR